MTSDFASVGMGFGTAMGFAIGAAERPTVLVMGDGGLFMTLGELETVVREGIRLLIIVMNDCAYGAELHYSRRNDMPVATSTFPDVDFAPIAAALGSRPRRCVRRRSCARWHRCLPNRTVPILLDCKINASVAAPFMDEAASARRH